MRLHWQQGGLYGLNLGAYTITNIILRSIAGTRYSMFHMFQDWMRGYIQRRSTIEMAGAKANPGDPEGYHQKKQAPDPQAQTINSQ